MIKYTVWCGISIIVAQTAYNVKHFVRYGAALLSFVPYLPL